MRISPHAAAVILVAAAVFIAGCSHVTRPLTEMFRPSDVSTPAKDISESVKKIKEQTGYGRKVVDLEQWATIDTHADHIADNSDKLAVAAKSSEKVVEENIRLKSDAFKRENFYWSLMKILGGLAIFFAPITIGILIYLQFKPQVAFLLGGLLFASGLSAIVTSVFMVEVVPTLTKVITWTLASLTVAGGILAGWLVWKRVKSEKGDATKAAADTLTATTPQQVAESVGKVWPEYEAELARLRKLNPWVSKHETIPV